MENPFAVPAPLFLRKRKAAEAAGETDAASPFICEDTYHLYSVDGHASESAVYQDELARRDAVRRALASQPSSAKRAATTATATAPVQTPAASGPVQALLMSAATSIQPAAASVQRPPRHLAAILLERAENERSQEMLQVVNVARRLSSLSIAEHVEYMRLRQKRTAAIASGMPIVLALTPDEQANWGPLDAKAKLEQVAFMGDLERIAKKERLAEYTAVPPFVEQLHNAYVQSCRNQVMHLYPRYYEPQIVVRLHGSSASSTELGASSMKHVQEVASDGPHTMLRDATPKAPLALGTCVSDEVEQGDVARTAVTWNAISADSTAERLIEKHDCDVAMTSSTLTAIFDTSADECSSESLGWTIPVKSRVCLVKGVPRRQIYLDRPLVNAEMSAREKISAASRPLAISLLTADKPRGKRVSYHVWQLGDLKILVRTKTELFLSDPTTAAVRPVSLFVKPDHKPLGLDERLTESELRRMWLHSWIRGGSTILLGRLSPKTSTFVSWSQYQLSGLLRRLGSPGFPDSFEPLDSFVAVNTVLTSLMSLPPASFLLQYSSRSHAKAKARELHILRSATEIGIEEDHQHQFDLFQHINTSGQTSPEVLSYVLPAWPPVADRIPYTFRTGSCCTEMLQRSLCEKEGNGEQCDSVHLRLLFTKNSIKWAFEDLSVTAVAKRANVRSATKGRKKSYPQLTPAFPFCKGAKGLQPSKLLANIHAPIRCEDPTNCQLPHLSLHAIADRVADESLRAVREKRRKHKSRNRNMRGRDMNHDDWYY